MAAAWEAEVQERDDGNGATPPPRFAWAPSPDAAYGDALGGGYLELVGADGRAGVPLADGGGGDGSDGSEGGGQDGGGEAEAEVDPAALLPPPRSSSSSSSSPRLEAHAAFWPSYRSPALFLRGRWPDGGLMGLGDLEAALFPPAAPDPGTPSSPPPSSSTAPPPLAPADHQHAGAGGGGPSCTPATPLTSWDGWQGRPPPPCPRRPTWRPGCRWRGRSWGWQCLRGWGRR